MRKTGNLKKIGLFWCLLIASSTTLLADEVSFTAEAPQSVVANQQFKLVYTVNRESKDLRVPDMPDFDIIMGPSTSRQQSVQFINGQQTSSFKQKYTYILSAPNAGTYTIQPASISVNGKKYTSQKLTIKVLPPDKASELDNNTGSSASRTSSRIPSSKQTFIRPIFSKTKVYQQEAILLTYELYTIDNVVNIADAKFPEYNGFYTEEIELSPTRSFVLKNYDGYNYNTIVLKQILLFPQNAGEITIDGGTVDIIVRVVNNQYGNNPFAGYFDTYQDVKKRITFKPTTITVNALPKGAPSGFNGAVGQFNLKSTLSTAEVSANDAVTLKVNVSGNGNLKLLKMPEIKFPADFEVYDPKVDNNIKVSTNGMTGSKTVEYIAIPRFAGSFTVPSAQFVYFDPKEAKYKTLQTEEYTIQVSPNANQTSTAPTAPAGVNKEKVKNIGNDIRFIRNGGDAGLGSTVASFYGTDAYYMAYVIPLLVFVLVLLVLQKQARENANLVRVKNKRANKLARKRLKSAALCMKAGDKEHFYEAIVQALWGYTADKLNISLANLSKDNVQEKLLLKGATKEIVDNFVQILSDCEYARYAPIVDESFSLEKDYNKAAELIGQLENAIK